MKFRSKGLLVHWIILQSKGFEPKLTLQQILHKHLEELVLKDHFNAYQVRILQAIKDCKTSAFGYHREACNSCGEVKIHYNSCGNRHCPGCQGVNRSRWIMDREHDLFDAYYHHVTFTVPTELRSLFKWNKKELYNVLFQSMWGTLLSFSKDPRSRLEADIGVISVLHTWTQKLEYHPHLHCIIPSGGLTSSGHWKSKSSKYLFNVSNLSLVYKNKFCDGLEVLFRSGQLNFPQPTSSVEFSKFITALRKKKWVVNSKPGFKGKQSILEYLGRYTHKIAISNYRLIKLENGVVTFSYRDRKAGDVKRIMKLSVAEFLQRYVQHILPRYFIKTRHYGIFSTRLKQDKLALILKSLNQKRPEKGAKLTAHQVVLETTGVDLEICSSCNSGRMIVLEITHPARGSPRKLLPRKYLTL